MPVHPLFRHLIVSMFALSALHGQSTISTTDRYIFAANAGWIDFRTSAVDGVRVTDTCLAGYAYAANFGWIGFGSGHPGNGYSYANGEDADYGVNLNPAGGLTGYGYAPNIGYIQFELSYGKPRLHLLTGVFHGFAYSANIGWIGLETTLSALVTTSLSRPDADGDGIPDGWEKLHFGNLTTAGATTDSDGDGVTDLAEYNAGTDPMDASSYFRVTASSYNSGHTSATLTFTVVPSRSYRIEPNMTLSGAWTGSSLGLFSPDPGPTMTRTIPVLWAPGRFFRVSAVSAIP